MSALSESYRIHAEKLDKGRSGWHTTPRGSCHATREETKEIVKRLIGESFRIQSIHLEKIYKPENWKCRSK